MNSFNDAQMELQYRLAECRTPAFVEADAVMQLPSYEAALRRAVNHSGFDQEVIAVALGIDAGEFSRMLKDKKQGGRNRVFPAALLPLFNRICNSMVVSQWICAGNGTEPVHMRETRVQRLERELTEARKQSLRVAA